KLPGYVLPAIPPLALLCAVAGIRAMEERSSGARTVFAAIGITWLLLGIAAWRTLPRFATNAPGSLGTLAKSAAMEGVAIAAVVVLLSVYRRQQIVIAVCLLSVAVAVEGISLAALPKLDPIYSARYHAAFMRNDQHPDRIFTYRLRPGW